VWSVASSAVSMAVRSAAKSAARSAASLGGEKGGVVGGTVGGAGDKPAPHASSAPEPKERKAPARRRRRQGAGSRVNHSRQTRLHRYGRKAHISGVVVVESRACRLNATLLDGRESSRTESFTCSDSPQRDEASKRTTTPLTSGYSA